MRNLFILAMALCAFAGIAYAQESDHADDMQTRMNLAKMMHEIKPARGQVEDAIKAVAARLQPEQQQKFIERMIRIFDFERLEKISTEAMAEVFTEAELQAMVDYYGSTQARSITEKMPVYQSVMQPQITEMLDEAIIEARTGGPADIKPPTPPADGQGNPAE